MPQARPQNLKTCSISMHFDAQRLPRAMELLHSAAGPIRAKRGCRSCRVENDLSEAGLIRYTEEWDAGEAFGRNVRSQDFWRVLVALDLCTEEPEVMICDVAAFFGIDTLKALRETPEMLDDEGEVIQE
jgi:quinol monooxygenase YgiN